MLDSKSLSDLFVSCTVIHPAYVWDVGGDAHFRVNPLRVGRDLWQ